MRNPSKCVCACVRFIFVPVQWCKSAGWSYCHEQTSTSTYRSVRGAAREFLATALGFMLCLCFCLYANIQACKDGLNATDKIVFVEQPENSQQLPAARKPGIAGWALGVRVRVQLWLGPFLVRWATFWYIMIDILLILLMMLIMYILH